MNMPTASSIFWSSWREAGRIERRLSPRQKWNKLARIYLRDAFIVDCIVKDISRSGARLLLANENYVLDGFHIQVSGTTRKLKVAKVWKDGAVVGVRFI